MNLTQFSLFFPEKREFFLENSGIFYFGDIPRNQRQTSRFRPPEEDLLLFFSRRIGLTDGGAQVPLYGGVRLTGRAAGFGVGALSMQSEAHDGTPRTELLRRPRAARPLRLVRPRRDRDVPTGGRRQLATSTASSAPTPTSACSRASPQWLRGPIGHPG